MAFVNVKVLLVAIFLMVKFANANTFDMISVVEPPVNTPLCTGSLVVTTIGNGYPKRFSESKKKTGLIASSLHVEGCGCFYLYRRPNFKSRSKLITHHMTRNSQNISGKYIGFKKIKSIEKVSCEGIKSH